MTKWILMLFAVLPMSAWACPNLAGQYSCTVDGFKRSVSIVQSNRGGVDIYQVDGGGEILADGIRHQTPNLHPLLDKEARNYSYVATCTGNRMDFDGVADLVRGGQGKVDGTLEQSGRNVKIRLHLVTPDGDENFVLNCKP